MRSSIEPEQPQSILVAEFNAPYDKAYDQPRYHTALLLRNDRDAHPGILYQLHFNGLKENPLDELLQRLVMVPNIRAGMKSSSFKKLARATKVADGYEFHTRQMWNHILRHALEKRKERLNFDYTDRHLVDANNCRAGIVSALRSVNIAFNDVTFKDKAGTQSTRISVTSEFQPVSTAPQDPIDAMFMLQELREETIELSRQLPIPHHSKVIAGALERLME